MEGRHCFLFHFRVFPLGCVRIVSGSCFPWAEEATPCPLANLCCLDLPPTTLDSVGETKSTWTGYTFSAWTSDSSMIPRAPKMTDTGCSSHLFCAVVKALGFKNKQPCFKIIKTQKILNKASNQTTPKQTLKSGLVGREMGRAAVTSPLSWDHPVCPWSSWLWLALVTIQWGELRFVQSNYLYALHLVFKERNWKSRFELRWCWMW